MPKATFDLQDDERLSIEVHKYKCLYDKTSKGYKEKDRVINAWNAVEAALELAEGDGKKRFENLKKRYSEKKNAYKNATKSGSGSQEAEVAEKELKRYDFLSWLTPFLRLKQTISNVNPSIGAVNDNPDVSNDEQDDTESTFNDLDSPEPLKSPSICAEKPSKKRKLKSEENENEIEMLKTIHQKLIEDEKSSDDGDGATFGKMDTKELKVLPHHLKFRFKHDVNNLIFKYQSLLFAQSRNPDDSHVKIFFQASASASNTGQADWYNNLSMYMNNSE